jgi:hypothetical protein
MSQAFLTASTLKPGTLFAGRFTIEQPAARRRLQPAARGGQARFFSQVPPNARTQELASQRWGTRWDQPPS